ncbi:MAG: hypothetical protein ACI8RD_009766 [Bacillariaceae sp.]|jgi:hypothetical protein
MILKHLDFKIINRFVDENEMKSNLRFCLIVTEVKLVSQ